jgi:hypothetical protein
MTRAITAGSTLAGETLGFEPYRSIDKAQYALTLATAAGFTSNSGQGAHLGFGTCCLHARTTCITMTTVIRAGSVVASIVQI